MPLAPSCPFPVSILPHSSALFHVVVICHWCSAVLLVVVKGGQGCGMAGGGRRRRFGNWWAPGIGIICLEYHITYFLMITPCLCLEIDRMASGWHQNTSTCIRFNARGFLECKQGDLQQFVKGESKGCSNPEENRIRKMSRAIWADGILLCMKMGSKTKVHSSESANSSALSFIMWYCALFCQYSIYGTDPIFFGENPPLPLPLTLVLIHSWSAAASGTPAPGLLPPLSAPAPPPLLLSVIFHFHCCYNHTPAPLLLLAHSHYCSSNPIALSLPLIVLEGLSPGQGLTIPRAGQHMKGLETWKSSQKIHFWCGGFHAWA